MRVQGGFISYGQFVCVSVGQSGNQSFDHRAQKQHADQWVCVSRLKFVVVVVVVVGPNCNNFSQPEVTIKRVNSLFNGDEPINAKITIEHTFRLMCRKSTDIRRTVARRDKYLSWRDKHFLRRDRYLWRRNK